MTEPDSKERILEIARELFATQGYAGTSLADIAARFGSSKQAVAYHFKAKVDILVAIMSGPDEELAAIIARARAGKMSTGDILAAVLDSVIAHGPLIASLRDDPSVTRELERTVDRAHGFSEKVKTIIQLLAGPKPTPAALIRAQAAFAVVKHTPLPRMAIRGGRISEAERAEILAIARTILGAGEVEAKPRARRPNTAR